MTNSGFVPTLVLCNSYYIIIFSYENIKYTMTYIHYNMGVPPRVLKAAVQLFILFPVSLSISISLSILFSFFYVYHIV